MIPRPFKKIDEAAIKALYLKAFPEEDLLPLIQNLFEEETALSFVTKKDNIVIGHVCFTICILKNSDEQVALLGHLAVLPNYQKQGIGTALIKHGFQELLKNNTHAVLVLGDPAYYGRFGFEPEQHITPPYPIPEEWKEAWQSIQLIKDKPSPKGKLIVPTPWQKPNLWGK